MIVPKVVRWFYALSGIFIRYLEGRPEAVTIGDSAPSLVSRAQIE